MNKAILLTICILSISGLAHSAEFGPGRAPGMSEEGGHMGPPPKDQKIDLNDIKFEYDSKNDLFKNADEAKEYQSLFEKYKTSKEITDHIEKLAADKKSKMENMRKSGKPPEFSRMKEERDAEKFNLLKEIKTILEKKKKDNMATLVLTEEVKCGGGKNLPVIEKATTDSMKDTSKVAKIILTEDELAKMKKDIKEEVKKEMMKEMADKPKDDFRGGGERPRFEEKSRGSDEEDRPKMAQGKNRKQMPGGGGRGGEDTTAMFASQMSAQMGGSQMGMPNSQMGMNQMGNSQMGMNQMGNSQMMNRNQMPSRDQMIQNQISVPQMNYNQQYANQYQAVQGTIGIGLSSNSYSQGMGGSQMGMNQMRRPPMQMNQNQNQNQYQNYGYQTAYPAYAYQSNTDQNYTMTSQYGYNVMAPQMDYGYTGSNSMMPAYSGQTNYQYQQSMPSYSQYSLMGY